MKQFPHLAQRVFNRPVAILPEKAEMITAVLADRLGISALMLSAGRATALQPMMWFDDDDYEKPAREPDKGYDVCMDVALIPVKGTLTHRLGSIRPYSGMTGYDGIRQAFNTAMDDASVKAIVLDINSPGGEVSGCFELADVIYAARGIKPVWAICDDMAFSAAYAIASAASRIIVPRTGGVGSIGVVCMHVDYSKALEKAGIEVTLIQYGAQKTDRAEVKPLSSPAQKRLQADIDAVGEIFVETVARNRNLSVAQVRNTEAATYQGLLGVDAGLADAVLAPDAAFQDLLNQL